MTVVGTEARQQIIEALIDEAGSVSHYEIIAATQDDPTSVIIPPSALMPEQVDSLAPVDYSPCGNYNPTVWERVQEWWMCLEPRQRRFLSLLVTLAGTLSLTLVLFAVRLRRVYCARSWCGYQAVETVVAVDEKLPVPLDVEVFMEPIEDGESEEIDEKKALLSVE